MSRAEVVRVFRFEASHSLPGLPSGHPCRRLHGHSWRLEVRAAGPVDEERGWVLDFAELERAVQPLLGELDHAHLNELPGLGPPTCENLARWVWRRLAPALPLLAEVAVWETETTGCAYRGGGEPGGQGRR